MALNASKFADQVNSELDTGWSAKNGKLEEGKPECGIVRFDLMIGTGEILSEPRRLY